MAIINENDAQALMAKALGFSKADECEINLNGQVGGNIRYALNTVTTSGYVDDTTMVIQSSFGKKLGTTTLNQFDDASIARAVRASEELARLAPENPEYMPRLPQQEYVEGLGYVEATAAISPEFRAEAAANSILPSREKDLTAAGFMNDQDGFTAMANSRGLKAYYRATNVAFSTTVRTRDGTGSGWATRDYNDVRKLDTAEAAGIAVDKALKSREPRAIEPGKYTVVLEPAASAQLIANMAGAFDRRLIDEGRSFLAGEGGASQVGEKLFDERVTLFSDPRHEGCPYSPWSGDGQAQKRRVWIENGVVNTVGCSRYWADQKDIEAIPNPGSIIMAGGDASLEDMIKDVRRGILMTRAWYIRTVDPQTQLYTGLTRDGTFYIENGELRHPIKNLRFNESPVIMLNNLEALGKPVRLDGNEMPPMMVPPMIVRDFTFTSLSDAV